MRSIELKRLFWKDMRQQIPIVISIAILGTLILGVLYLVTQPSPAHQRYFMATAVLMACIQALATGVTLFAGEDEERTTQFLRILPLHSKHLVASKMLAGVLCCVVTALILAAVAWIATYFNNRAFGAEVQSTNARMFGEFWEQNWLGSFFTCVLLPPLELFAWGLLVSLWVRKPMAAAIIAPGIWSIVSFSLENYFSDESGAYFFEYKRLSDVWLLRSVCVIAVLTGVTFLGRRWLSHSGRRGLKKRSAERGDASRSPGSVWSRLIWQTFRQSKTGMVWLAAVAMVGVLLTVANLYFYLSDWGLRNVSIPLGLWFSVPVVAATFAGIATFLSDHRRDQFRFFSQHGEYTTVLWAARIFPWAFLSLVIFAASTFISFLAFNRAVRYGDPDFWVMVGPVNSLGILTATHGLFAIGGFCSGQLASFFFRNPLIAAIAGLGTAIALSAWGALLMMLSLSLIWMMLPISAGMLFATWWLMSDRLSSRTGIVFWGKSLLAVGIPLALILWQIPSARKNQLPELPDQIKEQLASYLDDSAMETARRYREALESVKFLPEEKTEKGKLVRVPASRIPTLADKEIDLVISENRQVFRKLKSINRQPSCFPFLMGYLPQKRNYGDLLGRLYCSKAVWHERRGEFEDALNCYLSWLRAAERSNVYGDFQCRTIYNQIGRWSELVQDDPELLKESLSRLQDAFGKMAPRSGEPIAFRYIANMKLGLEQGQRPYRTGHKSGYSFLSSLRKFSWEQKRALRMEALNAAWMSESFDKKLAHGSISNDAIYLFQQRAKNVSGLHPDSIYFQWLAASNSIESGNAPIWYDEIHLSVFCRELLLLKIGLLAWKSEHGEYPKSITELPVARGEARPSLVSTFSGNRIRFLPNGFDNNVFQFGAPAEAENLIIAKGVPCLIDLDFIPLQIADASESGGDSNDTSDKPAFLQPLGRSSGINLIRKYRYLWTIGWTNETSD